MVGYWRSGGGELTFYPLCPRVYKEFKRNHPECNLMMFLAFDIERVRKYSRRELIRDDRWCQSCKAKPTWQVLNMPNLVIMSNGSIATVDHVIPKVLGGPDIPENTQLLCHLCNEKKGQSAPLGELFMEASA